MVALLVGGAAGTPSPLKSVRSALMVNQELEVRAKTAESSLVEVKKSLDAAKSNLDELKAEKAKVETAWNEKYEKLRDELSETRLASHLSLGDG